MTLQLLAESLHTHIRSSVSCRVEGSWNRNFIPSHFTSQLLEPNAITNFSTSNYCWALNKNNTPREERKMAQKSGRRKEEKKAKWTERRERFLNLETGLDMNAEIDCYLFGCFIGVRAAPALLCAHIDSINFENFFSFHCFFDSRRSNAPFCNIVATRTTWWWWILMQFSFRQRTAVIVYGVVTAKRKLHSESIILIGVSLQQFSLSIAASLYMQWPHTHSAWKLPGVFIQKFYNVNSHTGGEKAAQYGNFPRAKVTLNSFHKL